MFYKVKVHVTNSDFYILLIYYIIEVKSFQAFVMRDVVNLLQLDHQCVIWHLAKTIIQYSV